mgnify:CR=1 FL=1
MSNYFSKLPDFNYVSRLPDAKISDYITVKNLFKRGLLREDIFQNLTIFTKYSIKGDDRPDNVAYEFYGDQNLDWLVLICNNIINVQSEWPLTQRQFDEYLLEKYDNVNRIYNEIHHYETTEVRNSEDIIIVPEGLQVESDYSLQFYDSPARRYTIVSPVKEISNYEYELKSEEEKRNIFLLKPRYVNIAKDDLEEMMTYGKGSTQYISCLLYTSPSPRDGLLSRMPSSA